MNEINQSPYTADDDLATMADEKANLRDFLLGMTPNLLAVTQGTLDAFAHIESTLDDKLLPRWQAAQKALACADPDENDFTLLGTLLPSYFAGVTTETFPGVLARSKSRHIRQAVTNPSTLISQGKLDG